MKRQEKLVIVVGVSAGQETGKFLSAKEAKYEVYRETTELTRSLLGYCTNDVNVLPVAINIGARLTTIMPATILEFLEKVGFKYMPFAKDHLEAIMNYLIVQKPTMYQNGTFKDPAELMKIVDHIDNGVKSGKSNPDKGCGGNCNCHEKKEEIVPPVGFSMGNFKPRVSLGSILEERIAKLDEVSQKDLIVAIETLLNKIEERPEWWNGEGKISAAVLAGITICDVPKEALDIEKYKFHYMSLLGCVREIKASEERKKKAKELEADVKKLLNLAMDDAGVFLPEIDNDGVGSGVYIFRDTELMCNVLKGIITAKSSRKDIIRLLELAPKFIEGYTHIYKCLSVTKDKTVDNFVKRIALHIVK